MYECNDVKVHAYNNNYNHVLPIKFFTEFITLMHANIANTKIKLLQIRN